MIISAATTKTKNSINKVYLVCIKALLNATYVILHINWFLSIFKLLEEDVCFWEDVDDDDDDGIIFVSHIMATFTMALTLSDLKFLHIFFVKGNFIRKKI